MTKWIKWRVYDDSRIGGGIYWNIRSSIAGGQYLPWDGPNIIAEKIKEEWQADLFASAPEMKKALEKVFEDDNFHSLSNATQEAVRLLRGGE